MDVAFDEELRTYLEELPQQFACLALDYGMSIDVSSLGLVDKFEFARIPDDFDRLSTCGPYALENRLTHRGPPSEPTMTALGRVFLRLRGKPSGPAGTYCDRVQIPPPKRISAFLLQATPGPSLDARYLQAPRSRTPWNRVRHGGGTVAEFGRRPCRGSHLTAAERSWDEKHEEMHESRRCRKTSGAAFGAIACPPT